MVDRLLIYKVALHVRIVLALNPPNNMMEGGYEARRASFDLKESNNLFQRFKEGINIVFGVIDPKRYSY